jgi:pimeloyl-ACP methyl ester carboxylesterase
MIADVGIVARFIAERSRSETVHLIGHSMGGMIAVATACKLPSLYQSVCILGSTMCYYKSSSVWAGLIPILAYAKLLSLNRLPIAAVSTLVSGLTGRAFSGPIDRFLVNPHNVHPPALRLLFAGGFNPVSMR